MYPYFLNPLVLLLLLLLIPLVVYTGKALLGVTRFRKWVIIITRCLLLLLLVFALAGLKLAHKSEDFSVMYLLDVSRSIPRQKVGETLDWLNTSTEKMGQKDHAGLVVFGAESSIEHNLTQQLSIDTLKSHPPDTRTDIASAIRLCLSAFPGYTQKKIVLISDGNENLGDVIDTAYMAQSNKVPIDVYPITISRKNDVRIEKVVSPNTAVKDAPFDFKLFLEANNDTTCKVRIFKDDALLLDDTVSVEKEKKNLYSIKVTLPESGFHTFKALIESPDDEIAQNNTMYSFTHIKDVPKVLFVEGNDLSQSVLPALLSREKVNLDLIEPAALPDTINGFLSYDCIVFSNVSIDRIKFSQMEIIEKAVHDFGIGLVVIGGDQSYGPGGYQDTPLEAAMPVSMEIRHKKVLPNGALVVILHTCEIPAGNMWARELTIAALNVLSRKDYFGVLYYGAGEQWLFKPELVGDKKGKEKLIRQVVPGDMPTFDRTLQMACDELSRLDTYVKHIVIVSDGDPATPNANLVKEIANEKITISTVVINPHSPRDADVMAALAKTGNGNFYYPQTYNELPRIFTKEAMTIRKSAIMEKPFIPQYVKYSDALTGISSEEFPQMLGYVSTTGKDSATIPLTSLEDDPLLATWRCGLGKSVAFTSDATSRWARDWLQWGKFDKFWVQLIRWATRETAQGNYLVSTSMEGDETTLMLDALDDEGYFINYLQPRVQIIDPDLDIAEKELVQISPGKYAATFTSTETGNYLLSVNVGDPEKPQIVVGGVSNSYSPEFNDSSTNTGLLNEIARISGGRVIDPETDVFSDIRLSVSQPREVWQYLVGIAVILFLFDIFVRRVIFGWSDVRELAAKTAAQIGKVPQLIRRSRKVPATAEPTEVLLRKRQEIREQHKLKEQVSSDLLRRIKRERVDVEPLTHPEQERIKPSKEEIKEELEVDTPVDETTHISRLLDAKKRKKK